MNHGSLGIVTCHLYWCWRATQSKGCDTMGSTLRETIMELCLAAEAQLSPQKTDQQNLVVLIEFLDNVKAEVD